MPHMGKEFCGMFICYTLYTMYIFKLQYAFLIVFGICILSIVV